MSAVNQPSRGIDSSKNRNISTPDGARPRLNSDLSRTDASDTLRSLRGGVVTDHQQVTTIHGDGGYNENDEKLLKECGRTQYEFMSLCIII